MSYTPGPWKVSAYEGGLGCVRDNTGIDICKIVHNNSANTALIAAAPDLLNALEKLVEQTKRYVPEQAATLAMFDAMSISKAAIKKAGG